MVASGGNGHRTLVYEVGVLFGSYPPSAGRYTARSSTAWRDRPVVLGNCRLRQIASPLGHTTYAYIAESLGVFDHHTCQPTWTPLLLAIDAMSARRVDIWHKDRVAFSAVFAYGRVVGPCRLRLQHPAARGSLSRVSSISSQASLMHNTPET